MDTLKAGQNRCAFVVVFLVAATLMLTSLQHPLRIPPDAAVHLQAAKMILSGKVPYVDFFDRDPPMVSYLNVPAALIAAQLHQPLPLPYEILVCLTVAGSCILLSAVLLSSLPADPVSAGVPPASTRKGESRHYPFLIAAYALFSLLIGPELGTREHLLVLFCTPYLFVRFARAAGTSTNRSVAIAAGLAAGIGFNLDWIFLAYPLILEVFYLIYGAKDWRRFFKAPELASLLAVTALYLLHFLFLSPKELFNYVTIVAPLSRAMCDLPDAVLGFVTKSPDRRDIISIFSATLMLAFLLSRRCSFMMPLTIFAFTCLEIYIYRALGFSHELLPLILACTLTTALSFSIGFHAARQRFKWQQSVAVKCAGASILTFGFLGMAAYLLLQPVLFGLHDAKTGAPLLGDLSPFAQRLAAATNHGDRVLFINGFERPAYPLIVQLGLEPGSRWLYEFPVRAFLKLDQHPDSPYAPLLKYKDAYYSQLLKDIVELKPKFIAIQSGELGLIFDTSDFHQLIRDYKIDPEFNFNIYSEFENMDQHRLEVVGDEYAFAVYRLDTPFAAPHSWR